MNNNILLINAARKSKYTADCYILRFSIPAISATFGAAGWLLCHWYRN
jgi:hypothetical protein